MAVFRDQDTDPKESFIYHNAGIAGIGGSSYIDSVILRDRDANTAWTAASDATLEERRYLVQNWRADVTTMVNTSGEPIEWYRYTAYGQPTSHPIADINGDGSVTSADTAAWLDVQAGDSSGSVWLTDDLNRDDVFPGDTADDTFFYAQQTAASGLASGYDRQSAYGLRKGYAGYEWDDTLAMWHVRHRVLDSKSGKWTRRDPLGYVDGVSDVEYVGAAPIHRTDSLGLFGTPFGRVCNETTIDILVCGNFLWDSGCRWLRPGECSSMMDDDFYYIPGKGWYKCEDLTTCSPTDKAPGSLPWEKERDGLLRKWLPTQSACREFCEGTTTDCGSFVVCAIECLRSPADWTVPIPECPSRYLSKLSKAIDIVTN